MAWLPLAGLVVDITIQIMRISRVLSQDPLRLGVGEVVAVVVTTRRRRQLSSRSRRLLPDLPLRFRLRSGNAAAAYPVSPGDDWIHVQDLSGGDFVYCGAGNDTAYVDSGDAISLDCEK